MTDVSEILDRQREDLDSVRILIDEALQQKSTKLIEFAKLFVESMAILHETERKAHGIDADSISLVRLALDEKAKRMRDG